MERSSVLEMKTSPELLTSTGFLVSTKAVLINQGKPRHSMSKTLEPTMLDMAMSDFPDRQETVDLLVVVHNIPELITDLYLLWPPSHWPRCRGYWSQQPAV